MEGASGGLIAPILPPMRILTAGNGYPPYSQGGYERVWESAVEHMRAQGHEVAVLTTGPGARASHAEDGGVERDLRWHLRGGEFMNLGFPARTALTRHNLRALARKLASFRPHLVAWWSMGGLSLTMLELVRRRRIPAVAFVHDDWLDYGRRVDPWLWTFTGPRRGRFVPTVEKLSRMPAAVDFRTAAEYIFVSEFTRDHALASGLELDRTAVANSGIHADFLEPAAPREWRWQLLYAGRIDRRKGIDTSIAALADLPPEARLEVVGAWDAAEEERLRSMARELGVTDQVRFRGGLGRDGLLAAYADADAVVFPVRWSEPWGLVPLEAMGRGRPVIATGRGGSGEYLEHERNCLLFEADDHKGLAAAVRRLAASADLRETLRHGGFATAPLHTEERFNGEVEAAVERAAALRARVPV